MISLKDFMSPLLNPTSNMAPLLGTPTKSKPDYITGNGAKKSCTLLCGDYSRTSSASSMLVSLGWDTLQSQ